MLRRVMKELVHHSGEVFLSQCAVCTIRLKYKRLNCNLKPIAISSEILDPPQHGKEVLRSTKISMIMSELYVYFKIVCNCIHELLNVFEDSALIT